MKGYLVVFSVTISGIMHLPGTLKHFDLNLDRWGFP